MNFEEFDDFLREACPYEAIYDDSADRRILVIRLLDAFEMVTTIIREERARACRIVTGLCISDNNAREICGAIKGKE